MDPGKYGHLPTIPQPLSAGAVPYLNGTTGAAGHGSGSHSGGMTPPTAPRVDAGAAPGSGGSSAGGFPSGPQADPDDRAARLTAEDPLVSPSRFVRHPASRSWGASLNLAPVGGSGSARRDLFADLNSTLGGGDGGEAGSMASGSARGLRA